MRLPIVCLSAWLLATAVSPAADWNRFRGPNGSGVALEAEHLPTEFSATKNLQWKIALPGPGSSCPIVVGDRVLVTCWSGYGLSREEPGDMKALKLHMLCYDRKSGKQLWNQTIDPYFPEETYRGMFAEHGYASHTPVSDGKNVYAYFGKSGLHAFSLDGKPLWNKSVGTGADRRGWGSASSPIIYKDLVIVTASSESQAILAFNKESGEQVWKQEAEGFAGTWGTPVLVEVDKSRTDLVIGVPYEIWGLNPETGKMRWFCEASQDDSYCSSVVAQGDTVYAVEGQRSGGSFAVKAGGKDDVTKTNILWSGANRNRIGTPVIVDGLIYAIMGKVITCLDAQTGKEIYQTRLVTKSGAGAAPPADTGRPAPGGNAGGFGAGPGGYGGGRGGRGGMGGQDYSSLVAADGKLYFVARNGDIFVIRPGSTFEQLSVNRLTDQSEDFSASPAISENQMFIRSSKHLYCVGE